MTTLNELISERNCCVKHLLICWQIAISFATADLDFAKQIVAMLKQIAYIDDCDTLGQKADRNDIHKVSTGNSFTKPF